MQDDPQGKQIGRIAAEIVTDFAMKMGQQTLDNELILKVATEIMGWKQVERTKDFYATPETVVYLDEGRVLVGEPYHVPFAPEGLPYAHTWKTWNPLNDDRFDFMAVAFKFKSAGDRVIVKMEPEGYRCCIINGDDDNFFVAVNDAGLGRAICLSALEYMDECRELIATLER